MVILLLGVCSGVVVDLFIGQNRIYNIETAELNITSDARSSLDDIDAYVRQANRVADSYTIYTTGSQTMVLQVQSINPSNSLIPATYDYVVFYLTGDDLFRQIFPNVLSSRLASTKKLASNVSAFALTYNNASFPLVDEVITDLTLQQAAGAQTRTITISSKSILRNY